MNPENKNPAPRTLRETLRTLRDKEGITSPRYARLLLALITHKQHNGTLTRGR